MLKIAKLKTTIELIKEKVPIMIFVLYPNSIVLATSSDTSKFNFWWKRHILFDFLVLANEISTIDYIKGFMPNTLLEKCWKQIWPLKEKLSIPNIRIPNIPNM